MLATLGVRDPGIIQETNVLEDSVSFLQFTWDWFSALLQVAQTDTSRLSLAKGHQATCSIYLSIPRGILSDNLAPVKV